MTELRIYFVAILLAIAPVAAYSQVSADSLIKTAHSFSRRFNHDSATYYANLASEQYLIQNDSINYALSMITYGVFTANASRFESGAHTIRQALNLSIKDEENDIAFSGNLALANIYTDRQEFDTAEEYFDHALKSYKISHTAESSLKLAKFYGNRGDLYQRQNLVTKAKTDHERAIRLYDSLNIQDLEYASRLYSLARTVNSMGLFKYAAQSLKKSINIQLSIYKDPDHPAFTTKYLALGDILSSQNLDHEAIDYLNRALRISLKTVPNDRFTPFVLKYLSNSYLRSGDHAKSLELKKQNLKLRIERYGLNSDSAAEAYYELGTHFTYVKDYEKAVEYHSKAEKIYASLGSPFNLKILPLVRVYLGINLMRSGQIKLGQKYMTLAIKESEQNLAASKYDLAILYQNVALAYSEINSPDSALHYYQKVINATTFSYTDTNPHENPPIHLTADSRELLPTLIGKSRSLESIYDLNRDITFLHSAFKTIITADSLANNLRVQPNIFKDKVSFQSLVSEANIIGLRLCQELYGLTNDEKYLEQAFKFSEKNKSNLILTNLQENIFLKNSNIPDSVVAQSENYVSNISYLESELYSLKSESQEETSQVGFLENQLIEIRNEQTAFLDGLRKTYPNYYEVKYGANFVSIASVQKTLNNDELLLSYQLNNEDLYIFQITSNSFDWVSVTIDSTFHSDIENYLALHRTPSNKKDKVRAFKTLSLKLRNMLLPERESLERFKSLIIIPDNILALIPFGTLVIDSNKEISTFDNLNYLIKNHTVSYASSATLLSRQKKKSASFEHEGILAFAPVFDTNQISLATSTRSDSIRDGLGTLIWTKREIENISNYFNTEQLLGQQATEKEFRKRSSAYSVVHLASHGLLNESDGMYSKLVFSPFDTDSINDGYLNTRELFNMNIPADMVVLSACNTGSGQVLSGEGVMSLASGFFYAGAKSLVMTLWTANDESTAVIIDHFYSNLSEGQTKSEALRNAKLTYVENQRGLLAHPYYWAHFVVNGNDDSIVHSKNHWVFIILGLLLLSIVAFLYRKRRQPT